MSDLTRLKRVVKSWMGGFKRHRQDDYQFDDARMILTNLAMQFRPETLKWLLEEDTRMENFLQDIYAAEEDLDRDLVENNTEINPRLDPKVYEENGTIIFTVRVNGEEIVYSEFELPADLAEGTFLTTEEDENEGEKGGNQGPIDIPID